MIWLGDRSGYLSDWVTQQWVRWTGRRISLLDVPWLDGPAGNTLIIGKNFFADYARDHGLEIVQKRMPRVARGFSRTVFKPK